MKVFFETKIFQHNLSYPQDKIKNLHQKLKDAKGMRNILSHKYGDIDDEIVFETITKELIPDSKEFIIKIKKFISKLQIPFISPSRNISQNQEKHNKSR